MTIKSTINIAIEGGWKTVNCSNCLNPWIGHKQTRIGNRYCTKYPDLDKAFLDPLFWQSLGKALGWEDHTKQAEFENRCWKCRWHRFIDHLAAGHDAESFFHSL